MDEYRYSLKIGRAVDSYGLKCWAAYIKAPNRLTVNIVFGSTPRQAKENAEYWLEHRWDGVKSDG
jgi:hypothetical protein